MSSNLEIPFSRGAVVVTSISGPNAVLQSIAAGSLKTGARFVVTGDSKSPVDFVLDGCDYLGLAAQRDLPYELAAICPERSYTRKNLAYLRAISAGAEFIVETDDDNFPRDAFWEHRAIAVKGDTTSALGWINAYSWFTDSFIYPRGFPLREVRAGKSNTGERIATDMLDCPIQQGLADENPDVDAVYRMLYPLPFNFLDKDSLILGKGQWCPFNSQNTTFFAQAYPLLYLPAHCSFRMTDIWRSFVAQRILWAHNWHLSFQRATVYQERNEHNLLRDFEDEIPGYLHNERIIETLDALVLSEDPAKIGENLITCYESLIGIGVIGQAERPLLTAWLNDLAKLGYA